VTPSVVAEGPIGCCPITGWAEANAASGTERADARTGRDPIMTLAGTDVAPARLAKLLASIGRLSAAGSLT
jgi:hypothetical protein